MTCQPYRVLVLLSPKKLAKLNLIFTKDKVSNLNTFHQRDSISSSCTISSPFSSTIVAFTFISNPMELKGSNIDWRNFDCFLHKISDFFNNKDHLDEFVNFHIKPTIPQNILIIDSFDKIEVFYNRISMCCLMEQLCKDYKEKRHEISNDNNNQSCNDKEMDNYKDSILSLHPILPRTDYTPKSSYSYGTIWKPLDGCIGDEAHHMLLLAPDTNIDSGINDHPLINHDKFIVQEFIPHHQILYKIYIIGEHVNIILRKSIEGPKRKQIEKGERKDENENENENLIIDFDSQQLKLIPLTEQERKDSWERLSRTVSKREIEKFSRWMKERLGVSLFGWDLIISEVEYATYIVDINIFPGYDDVSDIKGKLIELIDREGRKWKTTLKRNHSNNRLA